MFSSRVQRLQAEAATYVRRMATPARPLLPPARGEARREVERHEPARTLPLASTHRPPPHPSPWPWEGAGRGGQKDAPFHFPSWTARYRSRPAPPGSPTQAATGPRQRCRARIGHNGNRARRRPVGLLGHGGTTHPSVRVFYHYPVAPRAAGPPGAPLGRRCGRRQLRRGARSALSTRLPAPHAGAILTDPGALTGSIPTNQPETRTQ